MAAIHAKRPLLPFATALLALGGPVHQPAVITWSDGHALPRGRDHHVPFVTGARGAARLHVLGGNDYQSVFAATASTRLAARCGGR